MILVPTQDGGDDDGEGPALPPPPPPVEVDLGPLGDGPAMEDAGDVSGDAGSNGEGSDHDGSEQQHDGSPLGPLGDADGSPSLGSPKSGSEVLGGSQDGVDGDSESDVLNAPTLRLGGSDSEASCEVAPTTPLSNKGFNDDDDDDVDLESPIKTPPNYDDSAEDQRDSQVSDGWMGKAHNYIAWQNREKEAQKHRHEWLKDLEFDLQQLDDMEEEMLHDYLAHAKKCYKIHGPSCYSTLASSEHFLKWVRLQKSQDRISSVKYVDKKSMSKSLMFQLSIKHFKTIPEF